MSSSKYEPVRKGIVKRTEKRVIGLFIDGTGLDRATRRMNRKVDLSALVRGVTSGVPPVVARYYTLIPYEDDSRQRAFLDAVMRAGLQVIVKRLPPKGVTRQVSVDIEMASDIVAFSLGHTKFSSVGDYFSDRNGADGAKGSPHPVMRMKLSPQGPQPEPHPADEAPQQSDDVQSPEASARGSEKRVVTVLCPSRDLAYAIGLAGELGADTVNADFGQYSGHDVLKSAAKWIDLSDSETIWRD